MTVDTEINKTDKLNVPASKPLYSQQDYATLQVLGVDIYRPLVPLVVADMPWLNKLFELLEITASDCVFKGNSIEFDDQSRQLILPKISYAPETALKKAIWQKIHPFVSQGN